MRKNSIEKKKNNYESDLVLGINYLKNSKYDLAKKYFIKAKRNNSISVLNNYILNTLYIWSDLEGSTLEEVKLKLNQLDNRFDNLKKIQNVFLHCYFNSKDTDFLFNKLISNEKTDFSRYNYFYARHLDNKGQKIEARKIIKKALKKYPRNLILNQYEVNLELQKNFSDFNCSNKVEIVAELLYIAANALSSQSYFQTSNFYLNFSKYLNKNFYSFDTLLAENFYKIEDLESAKKTYQKLRKNGNAFEWYSNKQISRILIKEKRKDDAIKLYTNSFNNLPSKGIYETYDYAEFLKNNEQFKESIKFFTEILNNSLILNVS